jgi:hypothetical protein
MSGAEWLAAATPNPRAVMGMWARQPGLVGLPVAVRWDVVVAGLHRSVEAMQWLQERGHMLGPVMACTRSGVALWLVAVKGAQGNRRCGLEVMGRGGVLLCPAPDGYAEGRGWIARPDGSGQLTERSALAQALTRG